MYVPRKRELVPRWDTIQYVPILRTIEKLFDNEGIVDQILSFPKRIRNDNKMEDFAMELCMKITPSFQQIH